MLDKLIKISSLAGAGLIFCGVLKSIIFYSTFNISIVDFLSISEIITSFLDDINILLIFTVMMTIVSLVTVHYGRHATGTTLDDFIDQLAKFIFVHKLRYFLFFILIFFILGISVLTGFFSMSYVIIYFMIFCFLHAILFSLFAKDDVNGLHIPDHLLALALFLTLVFSIFLLAEHDVQKINRNANQAVVYLEKSSIDCSLKTKNILLGKTDGFVFIHLDIDSVSS